MPVKSPLLTQYQLGKPDNKHDDKKNLPPKPGPSGSSGSTAVNKPANPK